NNGAAGLSLTSIDVNGGKALIQGNTLNRVGAGASVGLKIRTSAVVDAGQVGGGFDFVGVNGGGVGQGSTGGNVFNGYTAYAGTAAPTVNQAIEDLNSTGLSASAGPQGVPADA